MAVDGADSHSDVKEPAGRVTAFWGFAFVFLLLLSAGMVTVPGEGDGVAFVRTFYEAHRTVVVVAQLIGVAGAVVFLPFARGLQRRDWVERGRWVFAGGAAVTAAAVAAAVPPLVLCVVARDGGSRTISSLALASDLVDVVLFATISAFAVAVVVAVDPSWLRALSAAVALVSAVRAVVVLVGSGALELVAPMAFIVLVLCLAILCWRSDRRPRR